MKLRKVALAPIAAAVMAFGATVPAAAATFEYDFGQFFAGTAGPSGSFAHLSVDTTDFQVFTFDLTIGNNLNTLFDSAATYISGLKVNTFSNADPSSVQIAPGSWGVSNVALLTYSDTTAGVQWDFTDYFNGSPNLLTQGEEVKWTTTFSGVQNPPFATPPFLLKVAGYGNDDHAGYIPATPVPEPETYAMLLAGLGLMGFIARRRRERDSVLGLV